MPKIVEYPLASFDKVTELSNAVDYLGGSCTIQDCADHMKKRVSGGFGILISSAIKHDLLIRRRDRIFTSDLYKKIKLSYNRTETLDYQRKSFFHPVLYKKIFERFQNKELPLSMLDKLLIREFQVEESVSQKIAGFFVDGLKRLQLLKDGKLGSLASSPSTSEYEESQNIDIPAPDHKQAEMSFEKKEDVTPKHDEFNYLQRDSHKYTVMIKGNGMDSTIVIHDNDDYMILEAILGKIKKTLD